MSGKEGGVGDLVKWEGDDSNSTSKLGLLCDFMLAT